MQKMNTNFDMDKINRITAIVLDSSIEVHRILGPGFLEAVYEDCLATEFDIRGVKYIKQCELPIIYKGRVSEKKYRVDFMVEGEVPVELKAVETLLPIHTALAINYAKMAGKKVVLLINFNVVKLIDGYRRYII
jgi:GxxExxY protein